MVQYTLLSSVLAGLAIALYWCQQLDVNTVANIVGVMSTSRENWVSYNRLYIIAPKGILFKIAKNSMEFNKS